MCGADVHHRTALWLSCYSRPRDVHIRTRQPLDAELLTRVANRLLSDNLARSVVNLLRWVLHHSNHDDYAAAIPNSPARKSVVLERQGRALSWNDQYSLAPIICIARTTQVIVELHVLSLPGQLEKRDTVIEVFLVRDEADLSVKQSAYLPAICQTRAREHERVSDVYRRVDETAYTRAWIQQIATFAPLCDVAAIGEIDRLHHRFVQRHAQRCRTHAFQCRCVLPFVCAHDLVVDSVAQDRRLRCAFEHVVEPLVAQLTQVDVGNGIELDVLDVRHGAPPYWIYRSALARWVIVGSDQQVMFGIGSILHVLAEVPQRAHLAAVEVPCGRENRNADTREFRLVGNHPLPIRVVAGVR